MPNWPAEAGARRYAWTPWWLLGMVALWPLPGPAEALLALGALVLAGLRLEARLRGRPWPLPAAASRLLAVLFLAYWLPELLSLPDALDRGRALRETVADLRYLPVLWGVGIAFQVPRGARRVLSGLGLLGLLWAADAAVQAVVGASPLFWSLDSLKRLASGEGFCTAAETLAADRLGGVFGPCNLKLGLVLASLSPFALALAARRLGAAGWVAAAALLGLAVALGGARAAWLVYALVVLASGLRVLGGRRLLGFALVAGLGLAGLYLAAPPLQERVARTAQVLQGDRSGLDAALSGRERIWRAAACMARTHPLNGVGVRGFRQAWPDCDPAPEQAPAWGSGEAYHAHQLLLEVLSETGILGLLCWLGGAWLGWQAWRQAGPAQRRQAQAPMLALAVTLFPLNTHLAFYSTFWGGVLVLLCGLYAGALHVPPGTPAQADGGTRS